MLSSLVALAGIAAVAAAPAPVPSGGVGVRPNDTAPVYHTMSDCTSSLKLLYPI